MMTVLLADSLPTNADFFTVASLATLASASTAVVVVSNTFRRMFHRDWVSVPFVTALIVAYIAAASVDGIKKPIDWLIVFLNGCLLFCTAFGINTIAVEAVVTAKNPPETGVEKAQRREHVRWLSLWGRTTLSRGQALD